MHGEDIVIRLMGNNFVAERTITIKNENKITSMNFELGDFEFLNSVQIRKPTENPKAPLEKRFQSQPNKYVFLNI